MRIEKLSDLKKSYTQRMLKYYKKRNKHYITVGIHKKDNREYPNKGGLFNIFKKSVTTAQVGAYQEYGTATIPARMWLRIFQFLDTYKRDFGNQVSLCRKANGDDVDAFMNDLGAYMRDTIKDRIKSNSILPYSHNKTGITLVDTGQLVNSINYEVH